ARRRYFARGAGVYQDYYKAKHAACRQFSTRGSLWIFRVDGGNHSLGLLGLAVQSEPGIIIVGREHVPKPETAGEVVMAVEVPVAADLNEPGATAGATGHIAGDGDHRAAPVLPFGAGRRLAGLPGLAIERIRGGVA